METTSVNLSTIGESDHARAALCAARAAAEACRRVSQQRDLAGRTLAKEDKSPVTVADFAAQAVASAVLERWTPAIPLVAEEGADELRQRAAQGDARLLDEVVETVRQALGAGSWAGPRAPFDLSAIDAERVLGWIDRGAGEPPETGAFWTLDPIDGTKGFLRRGQYAVALALIERVAPPEISAPVIGALACPNLNRHQFTQEIDPDGCLFLAIRGQGAWGGPLVPSVPARPTDLSGFEAVRVSQRSKPSDWVVCESVETGHTNQDQTQHWRTSQGVAALPLRLDSQAKYGLVARGEADFYFRFPTRADYQEKIWDHAAGAILVREAGGLVHDLSQQPLDFGQGRALSRNRGVVARSSSSVMTGVPGA